MRRHPLLLLLLLAACARPAGPPPQLGLVEPLGGGVAPGKDVLARGYAFDEAGVRSVRVQGQEVLPEEEVGKKLVEFRFRLKAPTSGRVEVVLEAEDTGGQVRTLRLPLVLDAQPPRIVVEGREAKDGLLRVYGRVEDNVGVERVVLQQGGRFSALALPKGTSVPFALEVSKGAVLIAIDAAGNRASRPLP
ncbi:hypothetical protein [Thermus filiformis]|uniref:Lipoprotein n=1 Tax=Thermus filiformis TaxID=276 RepID=A0A0A2WPI1_THEFI|nr:hypothetical protein [Thermus filiformis]KGQ21713.2 hypothetical protein THFILI_09750 [Thermus filiformis]